MKTCNSCGLVSVDVVVELRARCTHSGPLTRTPGSPVHERQSRHDESETNAIDLFSASKVFAGGFSCALLGLGRALINLLQSHAVHLCAADRLTEKERTHTLTQAGGRARVAQRVYRLHLVLAAEKCIYCPFRLVSSAGHANRERCQIAKCKKKGIEKRRKRTVKAHNEKEKKLNEKSD